MPFGRVVLCLYKSLGNGDLLDSLSNKDGKGSAKPDDLSSSYNELTEAKQRLHLLEMKIQTLESRIARKYPDVSFLNFKDRKRILVSDFYGNSPITENPLW